MNIHNPYFHTILQLKTKINTKYNRTSPKNTIWDVVHPLKSGRGRDCVGGGVIT